MEITNERYMELIKAEMLYRVTKNALKNGVPYNYILVMLGEIVTPLAKVAVYNTPAEPMPKPAEASAKPVSDVVPTTEAPKPKATVKRRIPQETIDKIVELTNRGDSVDDIALKAGVSSPTVRKYQKEVMDCEE